MGDGGGCSKRKEWCKGRREAGEKRRAVGAWGGEEGVVEEGVQGG